MFGMSKTVVGLDVGSHAVKAVALTPNGGRVTLSGFAQAKIGNQDPASVVRQVIDQLGVRPRRLVTSVSGRSVIVRQVETPRLGKDELKAHIAYEADKYIPFGTDEVIIDCQPLPDREGAKASNMQVLLVAVRRGFVEDHISMLKSAGIQPEVIDVDVFALANAYELFGPGLAESEQGATALIDIGASKSNIAIVQGKRLLFTREVYLAGNEITDAIVRTFNESSEEIERIKATPGDALEALVDAAMPAFEDLANEIRLSFDYVEGQFEQQVSTVVLTGGSSQLATIGEILGNILGRPVHVLDPLAGMDLLPSKYDLHGLDANAPGLTVALGLAAHLLAGEYAGLGGAQSHGWQPRTDGAPVRPTAAAPIEEAPAEADETEAHEPPPSDPLPLQISSSAPRPPTSAFAPPPLAPPPLAPPPAAAFPPPPVAESADDLASRGGSTEFFNNEGSRSGLLVILDDDQEPEQALPPDPGQRPPTAAQRRPTIKLESFEDSDDQDGGSGLPQLPKL
jgi:type IV pilus assembly protein PilM